MSNSEKTFNEHFQEWRKENPKSPVSEFSAQYNSQAKSKTGNFHTNSALNQKSKISPPKPKVFAQENLVAESKIPIMQNEIVQKTSFITQTENFENLFIEYRKWVFFWGFFLDSQKAVQKLISEYNAQGWKVVQLEYGTSKLTLFRWLLVLIIQIFSLGFIGYWGGVSLVFERNRAY